MVRLFKPPSFVRRVYFRRTWKIPTDEKAVYLTFDDGPNPEITPFVLDELKKYNFKASFFCVGSNVKKYPELFKRILDEGHSVGNHTMNHEHAFKVKESVYFSSIAVADEHIKSTLFRPPYGRISPKQARLIGKRYKIVMWTWLSYDYDVHVSVETILNSAEKNIQAGSIWVLHDNAKITSKQKELLPKLLSLLQASGFTSRNLEILK